MFNVMNENEMMNVDGGNYLVPRYKDGKLYDKVWEANNSNVSYYEWTWLNPYNGFWKAYYRN